MQAAVYDNCINYLFGKLPMYQNIGNAAYKKDLTNTVLLLESIGNPHLKVKCIHVAGTNGKGSTSSMLASLFVEAGYKAGLYTSPHLIDFRERFVINGIQMPKEFVVDFVNSMKTQIETIQPSFFEISVAMAFAWFEKEKVDIAIIEVGLGGRLDSTNVIQPILSVITNIGWDHMDMLGDSLEKIAFEKAGIIKTNTPVVIGEFLKETKPVFEKIASDKKAGIYFAQNYVTSLSEYTRHCELKGNYQLNNIRTFLQSVEVLHGIGYKFTHKTITQSLKHIKKNTGLRGRWEVLSEKPFVVADTAHNVNGLEQTIYQFNEIAATNKIFVLGFVREKELSKILPLFPKNATYFFCQPDVQRKLPSIELAFEAKKFGIIGHAYNSVFEAYQEAIKILKLEDALYIGGSTFVVADMLKNLEN